MEKNHLITDRQFGFRKGKGVDEALFDLSCDLYKLKDQKKKGLLVFLDMAKCFDSIDRSLMRLKLEEVEVNLSGIKWFESYLSNRSQIVEIGGVRSNVLSNHFGIIQGSTLSSTLFLIYVNQLAYVANNCTVYMFADDTNLLFQGDSWEERRNV